jgi:hypothetical protein
MKNQNQINRTLLTILENQAARTQCAFEGLSEQVFEASPGGDCNAISQIGQHLLVLRRFQLTLLESPSAAQVAEPESVDSLDDLVGQLEAATHLVRQAIEVHDADDWYRVPDSPREGPWGEEPTLARLTRPLNDFTNHLGAVRTIRRSLGNPADRTQ